MLTVVIPAYNEAERIKEVIAEVRSFADEVLVIDDGSEDDTIEASHKAGAEVLTQKHKGYIHALKYGLQSARGNIIVTIDADGEHDPSNIPGIVAPIQRGEADLVLGSRECIPVSEQVIKYVVRLRAAVHDHGTGFRAMTKELAQDLPLRGKCTCGTLVLEAVSRGARIIEVPIRIRETKKKKKRRWIHMIQIIYVLFEIFL
ncbi:MAG: glycosyltransferase family 2 protein [Theionarchaea archaeon]|nr:glycosyltransferase family 2 protein [Theionarchaea archaeon]